jgi:DNA repair exonuclease SbcCD ATPase subunit
MGKIQSLRNYLEQQKGKRAQTDDALLLLRQELNEKLSSLHLHEQAREVIREVGIKTQQQLSFHISDITSLALEAVFNDPYKLEVEFIQRRNKTECDLFFVRTGERIDPLTASGGGAVDVAAFALRIASWSMARPRTRNTIILDEPFRFLSADNQERASTMLKELSQRLEIQFIIVTHNPTLASYADKTFEVKIKNGKSKVDTNGSTN